jgi:hypothetical protein
MSKSEVKAKEIIEAIERGDTFESIKSAISANADEWHKYSAKAYSISLEREKKKRKEIRSKPHISATSNEDISKLLNLNEALSNYALLLPIFSTIGELRGIEELSSKLPTTEAEIIRIVGDVTMHPKIRVLQKKGRIEKFDHFKIFAKLIDAATLSYYRTNFISCYLTLVPVVEGILIRWMGYSDSVEKPQFEDIRKFFQNSHQRQPCPGNILFHNIYAKACHAILNKHFYKPTDTGTSYANFNRHVASHLLNDNQFATRENCIRLFILIDAMTEIFCYESRQNDPRFNLGPNDIDHDIEVFGNALLDNINTTSEHLILGTSIKDTNLKPPIWS